MHFSKTALALLFASSAEASFSKDIVRRGDHWAKFGRRLDNELLSVAVPLAEYERQLNSQGLATGRRLEDFDMNEDEMYSFSGYSLKYAKCQPVQHFSENAVRNGAYSPLVTNDIVILRLCPQATCSDSTSYGCYYNYADYALTVSEYIGIMLRYSARVQDDTCGWCEDCMNGGNANNRRHRRLDEQQNGEGQNQMQDNNEDGQQNDQQADANENNVYACDGYDTYCSNYDTMCVDQDDDGSSKLDYDNILNYVNCVQVDYNNYAYFVRPHCDGSSGTIKMAAYYDNYCIQYAGNDVSVKNFGLSFTDNMFEQYYSSQCIDCSESDYPPFAYPSVLCNKIHAKSAQCTDNMAYDLFDASSDSSTCSYVDSLHYGAYDQNGAFSTKSSSDSSVPPEVTIAQKAGLVGAVIGCAGFIIYACYLHHAMTNLLIKSLSHRELLPPNRHHGSRRSMGGGKSSRRSNSSKRSGKMDEAGDWDSGKGNLA